MALSGRIYSISIHAPLTGGDDRRPVISDRFIIFQSTPPSREATPANLLVPVRGLISIHAPLTGGDVVQQQRRAAT